MTVDAGDTGTQQTPGQQVTMFTQDQVNHFNKQAKQGALNSFFAELGLDKPPTADELKTILAAAAEHDKQQQGQKGDVERLTAELATKTAEAEKVPGLEQQLQRAQIANDAGLKSRYWKYLEGEDEEAIKASVQTVLADVPGGQPAGEGAEGEGADGGGQQQEQSGTGTGLTPNPQQGAGGGGKPKKASMSAGAEAYKAKHGEKE